MPSWDVHFNLRFHPDHPEIVRLTAQIETISFVVREMPIPPQIQERLNKLNIIRAVRGTTGIEGIEFTEEEIRQILDSPPDSPFPNESEHRKAQEVRNAEKLMRHVVDVVNESPNAQISQGLILSCHDVLTRGIDYDHNEPGRYRNFRVTVGPYVPPETGDDVRRLMREFIRWFNTGAPTQWHPIIRAIVAHFYIVSIHPFGDGNGRTSRAIESYLLYQAGVNTCGFYSLANFYYKNRPQYIHSMNRIQFQMSEDLTPLVLFALDGLDKELREVYIEAMSEVRVISYRAFARNLIDSKANLSRRVRERLINFTSELASTRQISLTALRNRELRISRLYSQTGTRTITRDVRLLQQYGLIRVEGDNLSPNLESVNPWTRG